MQKIDVELALVDASVGELKRLLSDLPSEFHVEDRSDNGWGLVICTSQNLPDNFSNAVDDFLKPLSLLVGVISSHKGILRVGVFYDTMTCTMRLNSSDQLSVFKLSLEISTYPSSDNEQF